jgi:CHASE2 domain-containing sensor protein
MFCAAIGASPNQASGQSMALQQLCSQLGTMFLIGRLLLLLLLLLLLQLLLLQHCNKQLYDGLCRMPPALTAD